MASDLNDLVRLTKTQIKPAAEMLARAFQDALLYAYFIPDVSERKNKLPCIFEFSIRYGVLYGEAYATSPNLEGVAVWLPPEKPHMTLWRMIWGRGFSILFKLGIKSISRQRSIGEYFFSIHKHHAPFRHWYLFILGVDPVLQGKGYASILLKPMLVRIEQQHLPCYVETQNERNVSMYQHYGFRVVGEFIIPGPEISYWAMLREKSS